MVHIRSAVFGCRRSPRRILIAIVILAVSVFLVGFVMAPQFRTQMSAATKYKSKAHLWWESKRFEHNLDLPFPEGRTDRYVKFSNQIKALGWNNRLNVRLPLLWALPCWTENAHSKVDRLYVLQDYPGNLLATPPHNTLERAAVRSHRRQSMGTRRPSPFSISDRWFSPWFLRQRIYTNQVKRTVALGCEGVSQIICDLKAVSLSIQ